MDVDRLMRDLTIEQLTEIQSTLSNEGEQKKEELRQMVGRRYRDVLDASNTVRRLTEIADTLVDQLKTTREVASQTAARPRAAQVKKQPVQAFVLLDAIMSLIGDASDGLTDVFCLLLAENLHRTLSMDPSALGADSQRVVRSIADRLVAHRLHLDNLTERLGEVTDWQVAAGELVALALSKQISVEDLLDAYLKARQHSIDVSINSSTSLIGIITMIRETVRCVDDLFGHGQGIYSAFHAVTADGWCPEAVETVMENQLHCYERLLRTEISKVNAAYTQPIRCVDMATVQRKCTQWMNE
ncbi:Protein COGC-1 [Aphelenchoides avenae]|nr:Protein COGC-1 [Aphelenchus avenae]